MIVTFPDEKHPNVAGENVIGISESFAPEAKEIQRMLTELRDGLGWSQCWTAVMLGVTESTVVKWESGKRNPTGSAAKLIFLLHSQWIEKKDKVKNGWDLAFWGKWPCRGSMAEIIQLSATKIVPDGSVYFKVFTVPPPVPAA